MAQSPLKRKHSQWIGMTRYPVGDGLGKQGQVQAVIGGRPARRIVRRLRLQPDRVFYGRAGAGTQRGR